MILGYQLDYIWNYNYSPEKEGTLVIQTLRREGAPLIWVTHSAEAYIKTVEGGRDCLFFTRLPSLCRHIHSFTGTYFAGTLLQDTQRPAETQTLWD